MRRAWPTDPEILAATVSDPAHIDGPSAERLELAEELLSVVSVRQREAIELRMRGFSLAECARLLGISVRSVRVRLERGFAAIEAAVEDDPGRFELPA